MGKYLLNNFPLPYLSITAILYRIAAREETSSLIARSLLVYTLLYIYRVHVKYVFSLCDHGLHFLSFFVTDFQLNPPHILLIDKP